MLNYAIILLLLALAAGGFAFTGLAASAAAGMIKILFYLMLVGAVVLFLMHFTRNRA